MNHENKTMLNWLLSVVLLLVSALWGVTWGTASADIKELKKENIAMKEFVAAHLEQHKQIIKELEEIKSRLPEVKK